MTVGELERGRGTPLSSVELEEWKQYFRIVASEMDGARQSASNSHDLAG